MPQRDGVFTPKMNDWMHCLTLFVGEVVYLDKRRKVGIEARKRLSTGPLVLHDAEEVYHLIAQSAQGDLPERN